MIVVPNYAYFFTFKSTLSTLDGIYSVSSLLSYPEMVNLDLDLYALTYEPNGLSEETFNDDLDSIRSGKIAKLTSVTDSTVIIYIPEHLFDKIPDGSVQRYYQLGLAVNLGIFDDPTQLSVIKTEIDQIVATMTGSTNKTVVYTVSDKWMTTDDYAVIAAERKTAITRIHNHYTDKLKLIREIDSMKTLIKYYEDALKAL